MIQAGPLRVQAAHWAGFFAAFPHLLENAVDHGIETPDERMATGKGQGPGMSLSAFLWKEQFVIEVADDGRGIDWERVEKRARALGRPTGTPDDLIESLFAGGLSTREQVSEFSGRGVGLAAVRDECRKLGGVVKLTSESGRGTIMQFRFPRHAMLGKEFLPGASKSSTRSLPPARVAAPKAAGGGLS
jgi:two-component system chemotaxis sensor kinase CheA